MAGLTAFSTSTLRAGSAVQRRSASQVSGRAQFRSPWPVQHPLL